MDVIVLILVLVAIIFFVIAAAGWNYPRYHLGWLGLACLAVAMLLSNLFLFKV